MSFALRPYQTEIIDRARAFLTGGARSVLIQAPTGSGKTVLTAYMLGTSALRGFRSWFVVHRIELVRQSMDTFDNVGIQYGLVTPGSPYDPSHKIQICSVQTLARRYKRLEWPRFIVWDECHHIAAASWSRVSEAFPGAFQVGLTATPERLDGAGLGKWFDSMVTGPTVRELTDLGWLCPYRMFAPSKVDLAGVRIRMGDYHAGDLSRAVAKSKVVGDALQHYQKLAGGKRAVAFCVSVDASREVAAQFNAAGIPTEHVDGDTPATVREAAMARFRAGQTLVLTNCELFGEGVDVPAMECAILLRPTQSLCLFMQQVGRALRPHPGKEAAIILDHAGNSERHGLPDEDRQWSLNSKKRTRAKTEAEVKTRICPKCYAVVLPSKIECPHCGWVFERVGRQVEALDGELQEVDLEAAKRKRRWEQGRAESLDELVALAKRRGYKQPYRWAKHVWNARKRMGVM